MRHVMVCVVTNRNDFYEKVSKLNNNSETYYHCTDHNKYGEQMFKFDVFVVDATSDCGDFVKRIPSSKPIISIVPDDQPQLAEKVEIGAVMYNPYRTIDLERQINCMVKREGKGAALAKNVLRGINNKELRRECVQLKATDISNLGVCLDMLTYEGSVRGFIKHSMKAVGVLLDTNKVLFLSPTGAGDNASWRVFDYQGFNKKYCDDVELFPGDGGLLDTLLNDGGVMLSDYMSENEHTHIPILTASMLVPIDGEDGLLGYLVLGQRLNGVPYSESDVRLMSTLAPSIAKIAVRIDKSATDYLYGVLLNRMISNLPQGVLLCSKEMKVLSANHQFSDMAGLLDTSIIGADIKVLGSVLSDVVIRTIQHNTKHTRAPVQPRANKSDQYVVDSVAVDNYFMFVFEKQST